MIITPQRASKCGREAASNDSDEKSRQPSALNYFVRDEILINFEKKQQSNFGSINTVLVHINTISANLLGNRVGFDIQRDIRKG